MLLPYAAFNGRLRRSLEASFGRKNTLSVLPHRASLYPPSGVYLYNHEEVIPTLVTRHDTKQRRSLKVHCYFINRKVVDSL